jgi:hypothetical protein
MKPKDLDDAVGDAITGGLVDRLGELADDVDVSDPSTIYAYLREFDEVKDVIAQEFDRQAGLA